MAEGSGVVKTLAIGICAATFIGGALFAHALDAPHMIYPQEVRDMADVVRGSITFSTTYVRRSLQSWQYNPDEQAKKISDQLASMGGSWNMLVGVCSGATTMINQSYDLLLGDHTAAATGDGFINFGNRVCFWRSTGLRAECPAPEPKCGAESGS